ncbi:hypothetical protein FDUTEX481_07720 [Tolypothrix sp. PCC 7601]|nr:hypothetical protein FDUTEX481_07720 [Tolypothrix sp. PCC 7601]
MLLLLDDFKQAYTSQSWSPMTPVLTRYTNNVKTVSDNSTRSTSFSPVLKMGIGHGAWGRQCVGRVSRLEATAVIGHGKNLVVGFSMIS